MTGCFLAIAPAALFKKKTTDATPFSDGWVTRSRRHT